MKPQHPLACHGAGGRLCITVLTLLASQLWKQVQSHCESERESCTSYKCQLRKCNIPSPSRSQLRGVFAMSCGVMRYRLHTSVLTGYVLQYLLQQQQLHNGNQYWPKIFERNIFWEKIQVEQKQHVLQEIINCAEIFKENFRDSISFG